MKRVKAIMAFTGVFVSGLMDASHAGSDFFCAMP